MIVGAQNDQTRSELREKAIGSTYVMAGVIGFHDITPSLHLQMCNWIDGGARRKLGLVPRDHLKTSVWTIANTLRRISADSNIRILLGNETATNAAHFLRRIQAVFERNALYQWLFPELIPDFSAKRGKWSENEMLIPRTNDYPESTVETIGVGGAVVSRHYKLIKLDDLVGKEASESAEVMQKTIDWYQYCESLLENPLDTIETYGTRWGYNDLYGWIQKHESEDIDVFALGAYGRVGDGIREHNNSDYVIWPERFSRTELERIRRKVGSFKFSCQYLNDPCDPEATSFHESWLRYYNYIGGSGDSGNGKLDVSIQPESGSAFKIGDLRRYMRVDPAISERAGSARSAIVVDGVHRDNRKFLLEAWAKRCQPFEMIEKIFEFQSEYDCESIGIESVAYQRILKPVIEAEAERRGTWLNIVELKPDTRERKENRIRGIQPELERGNIWVRKDQSDFLEEYAQFPVGATLDILDALAYGPHQWASPELDEGMSPEEHVEQFAFEYGTRSEVTGY